MTEENIVCIVAHSSVRVQEAARRKEKSHLRSPATSLRTAYSLGHSSGPSPIVSALVAITLALTSLTSLTYLLPSPLHLNLINIRPN